MDIDAVVASLLSDRAPAKARDMMLVDELRLLRRSIELIVSAKVMTKRDLLNNDICLGDEDVEMLACLPANYFAERSRVIPFEPRLKSTQTIEGGASIVPIRR